ncbi:MAG: dihydroorotase [Christensenellales bacterium]
MSVLLKGGTVFFENTLKRLDLLIKDGIVAGVFQFPSSESADIVIDCTGKVISPGFADVHVHLREPGFSIKETIAAGTAAGARGGYTALCSMPNLSPVPDSLENMEKQLDIIRRDAVIPVFPYGAITIGQSGQELVDFAGMKEAIGFSDDGKGVQCPDMMEQAMRKIAGTGKILAAHCEDDTLVPQGAAVHDGTYARANSLAGIPSKSEWRQVERDVELAKKTGCRYHVCHVSAKESVDIIRRAKAEGVDISCETAPHYLTLSDEDLRDEGRFKMNPPIRGKDDMQALIEGLADGTIDMIATDHAPHTQEEKSKGLAGSIMGVVGLETAFPVLHTRLVKTGKISLERLLNAMSSVPGERFGIGGAIREGARADIAVLDLEKEYEIKSYGFLSKGKSTPFEGMKVQGECELTICGGKIVWDGRQEG